MSEKNKRMDFIKEIQEGDLILCNGRIFREVEKEGGGELNKLPVILKVLKKEISFVKPEMIINDQYLNVQWDLRFNTDLVFKDCKKVAITTQLITGTCHLELETETLFYIHWDEPKELVDLWCEKHRFNKVTNDLIIRAKQIDNSLFYY